MDYLQVKPEFIHSEENKKFKGIGKCLLDFLKDSYQKPITLRSNYTAIPFYEKNGFHITDFNRLRYIWTPKEK